MPRIFLALTLIVIALPARASEVESFTEAFRKVDIGPTEPGMIATIAVKEGDVVTKGQMLASLERDLLQVSLEIAKAVMESRGRLASAFAERDLRKERLEKLTELRTREHASEDEVIRASTDLAIADANILAAEEQQMVAALEFKKTAVMIERRAMRSPFDGVVTKIYHEEREFVAASSPTVLTLAQLDPLRITFSVPTTEALALTAGQKVPLSFMETDEHAIGSVELVAPVTDADSGTVRVKVLLDNPQGAYRCGVRCVLELPDGPATLHVPKR